MLLYALLNSSDTPFRHFMTTIAPMTGPYVAVYLVIARMNARLGLACVFVCFLLFFPPTPISVDDCRMRNNGRK